MTYETWRITFQDSEQAARAAFDALEATRKPGDVLMHLTFESFSGVGKELARLRQELASSKAELTATIKQLLQLRWLAERSEPPSRIAGEWEQIMRTSGDFIAGLKVPPIQESAHAYCVNCKALVDGINSYTWVIADGVDSYGRAKKRVTSPLCKKCFDDCNKTLSLLDAYNQLLGFLRKSCQTTQPVGMWTPDNKEDNGDLVHYTYAGGYQHTLRSRTFGFEITESYTQAKGSEATLSRGTPSMVQDALNHYNGLPKVGQDVTLRGMERGVIIAVEPRKSGGPQVSIRLNSGEEMHGLTEGEWE
jgi:hypothetical protein